MTTQSSKGILFIRWTARILGLILAGFVLLIFVGEALTDGLAGIASLTSREGLMMVAFFVMVAGLLLGWRWPLVGGALTLGGLAAFYLLDFAFSGTFPRGATFLLFVLPGVLYLIDGSRSRPR